MLPQSRKVETFDLGRAVLLIFLKIASATSIDRPQSEQEDVRKLRIVRAASLIMKRYTVAISIRKLPRPPCEDSLKRKFHLWGGREIPKYGGDRRGGIPALVVPSVAGARDRLVRTFSHRSGPRW